LTIAWDLRYKLLLLLLLLPLSVFCLPLQTGWPELPPGIASWLVQVVRFIILLAQAVPISLYVSLETVKVAQCKVGQFDVKPCTWMVGQRALCSCCFSACQGAVHVWWCLGLSNRCIQRLSSVYVNQEAVNVAQCKVRQPSYIQASSCYLQLLLCRVSA
jgi:hypothetical protein